MANPPREKVDVPFATDSELVEMVLQFERCEWPYPRWTHRTHLGVALYYLRSYSFDDALSRIRHHISVYNRTRGDAAGYHETITVLFMKRVHRYLLDHPADLSLAAAVEDLATTCNMQWPLSYYSPERLWSADARAHWVEPDRRPLEF